MRTRRAAIAVAVALGVLATRAAADPAPTPVNLHMRSASTVTTDGGTTLRLPPGYFVDEATHDKLDIEVRRLQDAETRLTAENTSLRSSASTFTCGPYCMGAMVAVGMALGVLAYQHL